MAYFFSTTHVVEATDGVMTPPRSVAREGMELLYMVCVVPVAVVNVWEWTDPEMMECYFGKGKKMAEQLGMKGKGYV